MYKICRSHTQAALARVSRRLDATSGSVAAPETLAHGGVGRGGGKRRDALGDVRSCFDMPLDSVRAYIERNEEVMSNY